MRRDASSPKAYIDDVDGEQREILLAIREVIRKAVPDVEEGIEYGMLDYPGLANLAAQKSYVALYVAPPVFAKHVADFPGLDSGKSCLRFRKRDQVDREALGRLLRDVRDFRRQQSA